MKPDFAEHISLLAAPIFAVMLGHHYASSKEISAEKLSELRGHAITQAHALWLDTLERPT